MTDEGRGRRNYLTALGAAAAFGLAGCTTDGGNGDDSGTPTGTGTTGSTNNEDGDEIVRPKWPSYIDDANGRPARPGPDHERYLRDATDRGYEDFRGQSEVTIAVDNNYFEPTFVWIDPGTTITWEFVAPSHNVYFNWQPREADLSGTPGGEFDIVDEGDAHSVTPEIDGIYTYHCGPHEGLGMKGAIAVGNSVSTVTAEVDAETRVVPAFARSRRDEHRTLRGESEVTVTVDSNYFEPTVLWVDQGATITWEFAAPGHNVKFNSQPKGSSLSGTSGGEFDSIDQGDTHTVMPTTDGIYTYYCGRHEGHDMKGAFAVGEDIPTVSVDRSNLDSWPAYVEDANDRGYEDAYGQDEATITVANNYYEPTLLRVEPGTRVTWGFTAPGHNVVFNSQPMGAHQDGTPGGEADTVDEGDTDSATFDTKGFYTYYCGPHAGLGMKGAIAVSDQHRR